MIPTQKAGEEVAGTLDSVQHEPVLKAEAEADSPLVWPM